MTALLLLLGVVTLYAVVRTSLAALGYVLVNTSNWAIKPETGYAFRVGHDTYRCYATLGQLALIQRA